MEGVRGGAAALLIAVGVLAPVGPLAPAPASASGDAALVINELHYHPAVDAAEFLELHNPGDEAVDLTGACFTEGIAGCFADGAELAAGGYLLVAADPGAVATAFPAAPAVALTSTGALSNGGERITLSRGSDVLDTVAYDDAAPWPLSPDGAGPSLELTDPALDNDAAGAWAASDPAPTPGAENSRFGQGPGPSITSVVLGAVVADAPVAVTATVVGASSVAVEVTVGFDPPTSVALTGVGDTWTGAIPAQAAGTLVRYRVVATSASGSASLPPAGDPRPRRGYVVARPAVSTALPVIDWFLDPDDAQYLLDHKDENTYVPAVIVADGQVWDGAQVRVHGNTRTLPKLGYKVKMPKGAPLVAPGVVDVPIDEFVLDDDQRDSSGVTAPVASSVYEDTNPWMPKMRKVHVERNGAPFGLYTFIEEPDSGWRERLGITQPGDQVYETEGNLGTFVDEGSADALAPRFEKVHPSDDDRSDLYELVQAIDAPPTPERSARLRELFDVPALIEFLAVSAIVQHYDTTVHNWVLVRRGATGRWSFTALDLDFTLGQPLPIGPADPPGLRVPAVHPYGPAELVSALRSDPELSEMFLRRVRTLADRYLAGGEIQARADALGIDVGPDVDLDRQLWPGGFTLAQGRAQLTDYLADRQAELLVDHRLDGEVPAAATPDLPLEVADVDAPADRLVVRAPTSESVDLSGWTVAIDGGAVHPVAPGTVALAGRTVELPVPLEDGGGSLTLKDAAGTVRATATWDGGPFAGPTPPAEPALVVEAAADQVETLPGDGAGVALTVAVANRGSQPLGPVVVTAPGSTCARTVPTLAAGAATSYRCALTAATTGPDRTVVVAASADPLSAIPATVRVRAQTFRTRLDAGQLPGAGTLTSARLDDAGRIAITWTTPAATLVPLRHVVVTGVAPGRAVPTAGALLPPAAPTGPTVLDELAEGQAVQVAVAGRNAVGTGPRTTPTPAITPRSGPSWPFASDTALVQRAYQDLDGRAATASEVALWQQAFAAGVPRSQLVLDRLSRPRWAADVEPIVRLYAAYFGRPPDPSGLAYWTGRRRAGTKLDAISASFAGTSEFARTYGTLTDAQFVALVYRNVLGRSADASGASYWTGRLASGWSRGRVMTSFSESTEGKRALGRQVVPSMVSVALLGAPPTATAAAPAVAWLAAGGDALTVVEGVRTSTAYGDRVG